MYLDWLIYFSVIMVTICKQESIRNDSIKRQSKNDCPNHYAIRELLLNLLRQLEYISVIIGEIHSDLENDRLSEREKHSLLIKRKNNIEYYVDNMEQCLRESNDFTLMPSIVVSSGLFSLGSYFMLGASMALALFVLSGTIFLCVWLFEEKSLIGELKYSTKRTLEQIKDSKALETKQQIYSEISTRIRNNILQARGYLNAY